MKKLNTEAIRTYAHAIDAKRFPYFCAETGEVQKSVWQVIRVSIADLRHYGLFHRWQRTRKWQK